MLSLTDEEQAGPNLTGTLLQTGISRANGLTLLWLLPKPQFQIQYPQLLFATTLITHSRVLARIVCDYDCFPADRSGEIHRLTFSNGQYVDGAFRSAVAFSSN